MERRGTPESVVRTPSLFTEMTFGLEGHEGLIRPGMKVALVDDEETILKLTGRTLLREQFKPRGFCVTKDYDPKEGEVEHLLEKIRSYDPRVAVIDYGLGRLEPHIVERILKKLYNDMQVILWTGYPVTSLTDSERALISADAIFSKPHLSGIHEYLNQLRNNR